MTEVYEPHRGPTTAGPYPTWEIRRAISELNNDKFVFPIPARKRIADLIQHLLDMVIADRNAEDLRWAERERVRAASTHEERASLKRVQFWSTHIDKDAPIAPDLAAVVRLAEQALELRGEQA